MKICNVKMLMSIKSAIVIFYFAFSNLLKVFILYKS